MIFEHIHAVASNELHVDYFFVCTLATLFIIVVQAHVLQQENHGDDTICRTIEREKVSITISN